MIILASTIILTLANSGIIHRANLAINSNNLQTEQLSFELLRGETLAENEGRLTVEEYIEALKKKELIEETVTSNEDGSKTVTTKNGFSVKLEQAEDNVKITFEEKQVAVEISKVNVTATSSNSATLAVVLKQGAKVEYSYYYRVQGDTNYTLANEEPVTASTYTITGLTKETTYEIQVVAKNSAGQSTKTVTARTGEMISAEGKISLASITWKDGKANITVEKAADVDSTYTMEYSLDDGANYYTTTGSITGITSGTIVLLRLNDGINYGNTTSIEIVDSVKPQVTIVPGTVTHTSIPVTVTAVENETGIKEYSYYIKPSTSNTYTRIAITQTGTYTFTEYMSGTELTAETSYDIKVEVEDNATNIGESIVTVTTAPAPTSGETGGNESHSGVIPAGGTYYVGVTSSERGKFTGATATYGEGDNFPAVSYGDVYVYGDYEYRYNQANDCLFWGSKASWVTDDGWGVVVLDTSKSTYGNILENINGEPINNMEFTFAYCTNLTELPDGFAIPNGVKSLLGTFSSCSKLEALPDGVKIPNGVTMMERTFYECNKLMSLPDGFSIPNGVTDMNSTFISCYNLTALPDNFSIPSSVTNMFATFNFCSKLTGTIRINANPTDLGWCLFGTKITSVVGDTTMADKFLATVSD